MVMMTIMFGDEFAIAQNRCLGPLPTRWCFGRRFERIVRNDVTGFAQSLVVCCVVNGPQVVPGSG